jgi:deazaflavin-dependent oxidoreductase (nitroreductase family)
MLATIAEGYMNISLEQERLLPRVFKAFNRFLILYWRLGLGSFGNGTKYGGSIMVIKNRGRKTGRIRLSPVNYAVIDGDIYCTAGFGRTTDWYRNLLAEPNVEIWLPDGRWYGSAQDVTGSPDRRRILKEVLVASGMAGPIFGVNPKHLGEGDLDNLLESYRLVRICVTRSAVGPGGPGDLTWVWPLSALILALLLIRRHSRSKRIAYHPMASHQPSQVK